MRGCFITLEGGEGTGKTTQASRLCEALSARGLRAIRTREPGGTPEAEKIREILVTGDPGSLTLVAEILLFFAARSLHVEKLIKPALARGDIVICDRFTDSTRAYQSYGHGMDPALIEEIATLTLGGFEPDLTLVFDLDVGIGLARSGRRNAASAMSEDRFEKLDPAFHERLRRGYLEIAAQNSHRCRVIDAAGSPDDIAAKVLDTVLEKVAHVAV